MEIVQLFAMLFGMLWLLALSSGPIVLGYQVLLWLRTGVWFPLDFNVVLNAMNSDYPDWPQWRGFEKIARWVIIDWPLSVSMPVIFGVITGFFFFSALVVHRAIFDAQSARQRR